MNEKHNTRIDKWLWSVRIYKTRSLASKACSSGKVKIDNFNVKSSKIIEIGDIVEDRKGVIKYIYKVKNIALKRMAAKLFSDFVENMTPKEELNKLDSIKYASKISTFKGKGRPTKKERRKLNEFKEKFNY